MPVRMSAQQRYGSTGDPPGRTVDAHQAAPTLDVVEQALFLGGCQIVDAVDDAVEGWITANESTWRKWGACAG